MGLHAKDLQIAFAMGYDRDDKKFLLFVIDVLADTIGYYNFLML